MVVVAEAAGVSGCWLMSTNETVAVKVPTGSGDNTMFWKTAHVIALK